MSEGRKRNRKSKLEVRDDDCDYEFVSENNDETTATKNLQKLIPKTEHIPWFDHDYCKRGSISLAYSYFFTADDTSTIIEVKQGSSSSELSANASDDLFFHTVKKKTLPEKRRNFLIKKMDISVDNINQVIKMCKYTPENLFNVSKQISSSSSNPVDRILDIEMRNMWGNVLQTRESVNAHESELQMALNAWQVWYNGSRAVRECPLFYQCHICNLAWWRLQPFREHLQHHDIRKMKVSLKENVHECMLVCSYKAVSKMKFIDIDEDCWKCGKDVRFHNNAARVYSCGHCKRTMYTCSAWSEHRSVCLYSNISNFNISIERQCNICKRFLDSLEDVDKHMISAHSVRSDEPVPAVYKECTHCFSKYFTYSTHNCPKSPKNSSCVYCCRKFATKPLAAAHMNSEHNLSKRCRFCAKRFEAKCQEMEHLFLEHSDNYQLVYKCTLCPDQNFLFLDEESVRKHKIYCHQKKTDRRRCFYEMMLVPSLCVETDGTEVMFQPGAGFNKKLAMELKENDDDFSIQNASNEPPLRILTTDVDVTVDKVDIKREHVEYDANGEIDYEVMLDKMFKQDETKERKYTKSPSNEEATDKFDFASVKVKTEPLDDIDIVENPVEIIKIKSEPVDDSEEYLNYQSENQMENMINDQEHNPETLIVKVEPGIDMDDVNPEDIIIKNEIIDDESEDDISSESIPLDKLIDLKHLKTEGMDWVQDETLNPDEMSITFKNPSGVYKNQTIYACHKCGYVAKSKQFQVHVASKCSVSPGIDGSFPCTKCGLKFVMFRNYVLHFDNHGYEQMACPKCGVTFDKLVKLLSHVQNHVKNSFVSIHVLNKGGEETTKSKKQVKCQECHALVLKKDTFVHWENHLDLKAKPEPVIEPEPELTVYGERVTMNSKTLEPAALKLAVEHLQSTTMYNTDKECVICYRVFNRRYDVKRHIIEHLLMDAHMNKYKSQTFRCQICFEDFHHQEKYKFHMRGHAAMPIFKCELCDRTFSDSSNFAKHKKTHNVRVLICEMCRKKFHSRAALQKHIADHSILVEIQCAFCEARFRDKRSYKHHKYQVHTKHKFKCVLCDLSFSRLQDKWEHDWEVHKERKQHADCPICLKSFRKKQDVKFHMRVEHSTDLQTSRPTRPQERTKRAKPRTDRERILKSASRRPFRLKHST